MCIEFWIIIVQKKLNYKVILPAIAVLLLASCTQQAGLEDVTTGLYERGTREYNLALGERRSDATRNYLTSMGISPDRISTVTFGKERPDVEGSYEDAWHLNRRSVTTMDVDRN